MNSKIILVTGATSGIGREEAKAFLQQGHTVIIHGRNRAKTLAVQKALIAETGSTRTDIAIADLTSMAAIRTMTDELAKKYDRLDVLVNNAGNQFGGSWQATEEGREKTMSVNLFAPVLLSLLLLDLLKQSPHARIVTVSSASHAQGGAPYMDDIELKDHYSYMRAYGLSKLYVIWAMRALRKHLSELGIETIDVNYTHPGIAKSSLGEARERPLVLRPLFALFWVFASSTAKGAEPIIYAATSPDIEGTSNGYYGPKGKEQVSERHHTDAREAAIWEYCLKVVEPYIDGGRHGA